MTCGLHDFSILKIYRLAGHTRKLGSIQTVLMNVIFYMYLNRKFQVAKENLYRQFLEFYINQKYFQNFCNVTPIINLRFMSLFLKSHILCNFNYFCFILFFFSGPLKTLYEGVSL